MDFLKARLILTNYDFGVCLKWGVPPNMWHFFGEYDGNHDEAANLGKKCPKFSDQTMRSTLAVQQSRKVALFWKIIGRFSWWAWKQPLNWLSCQAASGMTPEVAGHIASCGCDLFFHWWSAGHVKCCCVKNPSRSQGKLVVTAGSDLHLRASWRVKFVKSVKSWAAQGVPGIRTCQYI